MVKARNGATNITFKTLLLRFCLDDYFAVPSGILGNVL